MKLRWKITSGLVVLAIVSCVWLFGGSSPAKRDLEKTRLSLRKQGFKTDLNEFDLSTSAEVKSRVALLGTTTLAALTNRANQSSPRSFPGSVPRETPKLLNPLGKDAASVIWRQKVLKGSQGNNLWPELVENFATNRAALDAALVAAVGGPIRFEPVRREGPEALLPYLSEIKQWETAFGARAVTALHEGEKAAAWSNLLASTCLVTEYTPEPIDISHMVRFACGAIAFEVTWNVLQSGDWTDAQLADLQRRWEALDFWTGLPATAAYARANATAAFDFDRHPPLRLGMSPKEMIQSPKYTWSGFRYYWNQVRYRQKGSFEDEKAVLLYYRDRELDLRQAVQKGTWSEMRQLPAETNVAPFNSTNSSPTITRLRLPQLGLGMRTSGVGMLGRAAEAEARRRLTITALALERYHIKHGSYPDSLEPLAPQWLASVQADFMDGKPLRYHRTEDGHFVLYSVGLDCVDNGGEMRRPSQRPNPPQVYIGNPSPDDLTGTRMRRTILDGDSPDSGYRRGMDLVWPRPASAAEVERAREEELRAEGEDLAKMEEAQAEDQWARTARRQAKVEAFLKSPPPPTANDRTWRGRLLSDVLGNGSRAGTNKPSLHEILTLRQVITGLEPETVTFELPIAYDVLTNISDLQLYIDPVPDAESDEGPEAGQFECQRSTNGNCLLLWSTIYESPGQHALQVGLAITRATRRAVEHLNGPVLPFAITNLCQFSLSSAHFHREHGANLVAKLPESNAVYSLEIKTPAGELVRTFSDSTSNGLLFSHWDLKDKHGRVCTNDSFDTVIRVTLPDSGRSQTLRGP